MALLLKNALWLLLSSVFVFAPPILGKTEMKYINFSCFPGWKLYQEMNNTHWNKEVIFKLTIVSTVEATHEAEKFASNIVQNAITKIDGWDLSGTIGAGGNIAPVTGGIPVEVTGELSGGYSKMGEHGDTNTEMMEQKSRKQIKSTSTNEDEITLIVPPRQMIRIYQLGLECNVTLDNAGLEEEEDIEDNVYARVFSEGVKIKTRYDVYNVVPIV